MTDNDSTLTRCPHCQTRFRVTPGQLAAANGKVRCGHCMKVFNAIDHAEPTTASEPEEPATAEPPSEPEQAPTPPAPEPDAEPVTPPAEETEQPTTPESSRHEESEDEDEELIFADDPEEDATDKKYTGSSLGSEYEYDEAFLAIDKGETPTFYDTFQDDDDQPLVDDESWAESLLEEEEQAEKPPAKEDEWELPDPDPLEHELEEVTEGTSRKPARQPESAPREDAAIPEQPSTEATAASFETAERDEENDDRDIWQDLRTQPIAAPATDRRRLPKALWPVLAVALIGLLTYQLGWVHQDRLAQIPELRPWYERWCDLTGCDLRPLEDVDRIESRQLVVRSHPEQEDALLVEATLVNRAGFSQPFPAIALSFSNLNNDVVAQRVFQPEEYLGGDAQDLDNMPTATPIRVSLSLRDPGRDAISYRIDFLPSS